MRVPVTVALYAVLIGVGLVALPPTPDAVTAPANLLWHFRLASLAGAAGFWSMTGSVFGWLCVAPGRVSLARWWARRRN